MTSRITGSPLPPAPYIAERVFPSLEFDQPGEMLAMPDGKRLAVLEVKGPIYTFENRPDTAVVERHLFADLTKVHPQFYRLYGLAFHPRFAENRTCYVCYVLKSDIADGTRVSRFKVVGDAEAMELDLKSEEILITWVSGGHNGGHLQFGPDGYLYITSGDGGQSFPPDGRNSGQSVDELLASILRIDVDHADPGLKYAVPRDNPFVDLPGARGEVWAFGLRNPWKMCFDPADGSLWTADVGWEMWEMVYRVVRGGNYGWSLVEGRQPVHTERTRGPTPILPPTVEHDHTESRSITGGYFYDAPRLPELRGAYVYGDYVTGKVWALRHEGERITWKAELVDTPLQIVTFGRDAAGEVYLVDWAGTIHRLKPNPRRDANSAFPRKLSETGLFEDVASQQPAAGVARYLINAEPWADNTTAERIVALPGATQLGVFKKTDVQIGYIAGDWSFPNDGVLAKTVSIELEPGNSESRRKLETQVLHYDVDTWRAYNYIWNDAQTDAELVDVGFDRQLKIRDPAAPGGERTQTWHHASRLECLLCHTTRSGSIQGFKPAQLELDLPLGTAAQVGQLPVLASLGLFAEPLQEKIEAWPNPHDTTQPLEARARAYMHVNCAHCHRRGGGGSAAFDVQYQLALDKTALIGSRPTQGTFNIRGAQVIAPGEPYRSVLYCRMSKLGPGHMPQFGAGMIDDRGLKLLHDWIASLPPQDQTVTHRSLRADELRESDVAGMLGSTERALQVATMLQTEKVAEPLRSRIIELGTTHADPLVRDLFERYVPEEKRAKRLGNAVKAEEILSLPGSVERGRAMYLNSATLQCRNCHRVGDQGRSVGPDLNGIARRLDRAKLLESILEPSKTIDPKFVTHVAETSDGRVVSGLLIRRDERETVLRDVEGKDVTLAAGEVETFTPQQRSLMPEMQVRDLTREQLADLLEFLASLK